MTMLTDDRVTDLERRVTELERENKALRKAVLTDDVSTLRGPHTVHMRPAAPVDGALASYFERHRPNAFAAVNEDFMAREAIEGRERPHLTYLDHVGAVIANAAGNGVALSAVEAFDLLAQADASNLDIIDVREEARNRAGRAALRAAKSLDWRDGQDATHLCPRDAEDDMA